MKKSVRVFSIYALVPLLTAGFCAGFVWRDKRQHENDKDLFFGAGQRENSLAFLALARGANPNARDMPEDTRTLKERFLDMIHHTGPRREKYDTPLHRAVLTSPDNLAVIGALLAAGADPNASKAEQEPLLPHYDTPFLAAEIVGRYENAHLLLEHHADINARDVRGDSALLWVAGFNLSAEVEYLLQHGADTEAEDFNGDTALIRAACVNRLAVAQSLLKHGANVNHKSRNGRTALSYAHSIGYSDMEKLLRKAGAVE